MAYRFILAEKAVFPVITICQVLGVSTSGYYEWVGRPLSKRAQEDLVIGRALEAQHAKHKRRYGSRRHKESLGQKVGRNRVRRLMKVSNLVAKQRRRFVVTTRSDHENPVAENVLNRDFQPPCSAYWPSRLYARYSRNRNWFVDFSSTRRCRYGGCYAWCEL